MRYYYLYKILFSLPPSFPPSQIKVYEQLFLTSSSPPSNPNDQDETGKRTLQENLHSSVVFLRFITKTRIHSRRYVKKSRETKTTD
jgi:hypothetical protein